MHVSFTRPQNDRRDDTGDRLSVSLWRRRDPFPLEVTEDLTPAERAWADRYRSQDRRQSFVLGRFLAKRCLLRQPALQATWPGSRLGPRQIEILPDEQSGHGRPLLRIQGRVQAWGLSVSHTSRWTAVVLSPHPGTRVGVDLIEITPQVRLGDLWFGPEELRIIHASSSPEEARLLLWSIKESLYKTLSQPKRFVPRDWETRLSGDGLSFYYRHRPYAARLQLLRIPETLILTIAATEVRNHDD